ncbi:hypothetical protein C1703_13380 [Streptomyces sp. Go-475]|nr:hypothetical protein C1703_13380 [Streptomyces sp. Go-475]
MTAESTVPPPAGQPRDPGFTPVTLLPPRGAAAGFRLPVRRPAVRAASPLPLLAADGAAAVLGVLALTGGQRRPLLVAVLVAVSLLPRPHRPARVPAVLDELPAVCGRIAVAWLALGAFAAAYVPHHALSVRTLLTGFLLQTAASCAGRGAVHAWRRGLLLPPRAALVVGPAARARPRPCCGIPGTGCGRWGSSPRSRTAVRGCRC